jgi:hypothetical protein
MSDCVFLGFKDYLSKTIQLHLFQTVNIKLETLKEKIKKTINHNLISIEN